MSVAPNASNLSISTVNTTIKFDSKSLRQFDMLTFPLREHVHCEMTYSRKISVGYS